MIKLENVDVKYNTEKTTFHAVKNINIHVSKGDIYGIVGFSGAGKSTLVRTINLLQRPISGKVTVGGKNLLELNEKDLRQERKKIGMIFQSFNLMETRSVFENIKYPLKKEKITNEEKDKKVKRLIEFVELNGKENAYPSQLSGGEKQRVGIARSLANDPNILLCDEATSALDPQTTSSILKLIKRLNIELGLTVVVITHEMEVVKEICNKVAVLDKGEVVEKGEVIDVFTQPKSIVTKNFLHKDTNIDDVVKGLIDNEKNVLARIRYRGGLATEPLISTLSIKFNIKINILYGNIEYLQGIACGNLVVIISGDEEETNKAIEYTKDAGVGIDILKRYKRDNKKGVIS